MFTVDVKQQYNNTTTFFLSSKRRGIWAPPFICSGTLTSTAPMAIRLYICRTHRGDQIFFSATCPGQVACKNPLVLRNFLLVPNYFSNRKSIGQVANTTISLPLNQSCRSGEQ